MTRRFLLLLVIGVMTLGDLQSAEPIELPLTLVKEKYPHYFNNKNIGKSTRPPGPGYTLPKFKAVKPIYTAVKLHDTEYFAVIDFFGKTLVRLYVDANVNCPPQAPYRLKGMRLGYQAVGEALHRFPVWWHIPPFCECGGPICLMDDPDLSLSIRCEWGRISRFRDALSVPTPFVR